MSLFKYILEKCLVNYSHIFILLPVFFNGIHLLWAKFIFQNIINVSCKTFDDFASIKRNFKFEKFPLEIFFLGRHVNYSFSLDLKLNKRKGIKKKYSKTGVSTIILSFSFFLRCLRLSSSWKISLSFSISFKNSLKAVAFVSKIYESPYISYSSSFLFFLN